MAKIIQDFTKMIIPKINENTDIFGYYGDDSLCTTDLISLKSWEEIENQSDEQRKRSVTDFALMNNAMHSFYWQTQTGKPTGAFWLRSAYQFYLRNDYVGYMTGNGRQDRIGACETSTLGLCPALLLNLPSKMSLKNVSKEIGEVREVKSEDGQTLYHTIEFGEYPKTRASFNVQKELELMYNGGHLQGELKCTGRLFTTNGKDLSYFGFLSKQNPEFEIDGKRYVRVTVNTNYSKYVCSDNYYLGEKGCVQWVQVEPITFRIENYKEFEKGKAKILKLESDEIILSGLPFYPSFTQSGRSLWQNSLLRAFLNSAKTSEMDGNLEYATPNNWDFRNSGMLQQAFNMTRQPTREYIIPQDEEEICDYAFRGCVGIEKIIIPSHVTNIGKSAFSGCVNSQIFIQLPNRKLSFNEISLQGTNFKFMYISKDGGSLVLSAKEDATLDNGYFKCEFKIQDLSKFLNNNYRENFVQLWKWKQEGKIKFIPPEYTIEIFPSSEIEKYFINKNNQRWGKLVKTLGLDKLEGVEKNNALVDLMKIYYAIGGFSDNQGESNRVFDYVLEYVATTRKPDETPAQISQEIHSRFSKINLMVRDAYNPTFAKFFMKYYHENPDFMYFKIRNRNGELMKQDYLCSAHNAFDRILKYYPNRVVNGNEERALLTPRFVAEHLDIVEYEYVDDGNELLAEIVGRYGYSEEQFEHIQEIYNKAKTIKDKFVIQANKSQGKNSITFRILDKEDPLGFVLGDITNCCQHIGGAGEGCVDDGYINPNAGFLVFEESVLDKNGKPTGESRILGQAYIWYDPQTKTVCYDNIEIPTKVLNELRNGNKHEKKLSTSSLMEAVIESANAIIYAMNKSGVQVERVTTGQGYNDLRSELEEKFGAPEKKPIARNRGYDGYSDAITAQYVIQTYDKVTQMYSEKISETADEIIKDLNDIKKSKNLKGDELGGV